MQDTTRLNNFRLLAFECGSQGSLAHRLGIEHSQIVRFFQNKYTEISNTFAREIELKLNKPDGWLDRPNFELALTAEEWQMIRAYRAGSDRDRTYLRAVAQLAEA